MKKALLIAYQYPPFHGSSAVQRTLALSRYLPDHKWQPIVLTVPSFIHGSTGYEHVLEIPENVIVKRAFALDTAKHLSISGRYLLWMALPDKLISWLFFAVPYGLYIINKYKPNILWSTYPVATAHLIGFTLHCLTGIPWIADFRDPMSEENWPDSPTIRKAHRFIESRIIGHSSYNVFTSPSALKSCAERYPDIPSSRWQIIPNGYNEQDFSGFDKILKENKSQKKHSDTPLTLVHAGLLDPHMRDPIPFLRALSSLFKNERISRSDLRIIFRGCSQEERYRKIAHELGIEDIVLVKPEVSYREAILEMASADGFLIFQGTNCNLSIPAKIYEYLRLRHPILAMTDPEGDTAGLLKTMGINTIVPMDSEEDIIQALPDFIDHVKQGTYAVASDEEIRKYDRKNQVFEFVSLFENAMSREAAKVTK